MPKALDPAFVEKFMREQRNFKLLKPYVNSSTPMKGICLTCGAEGAPRWKSIKQGQGACNPCGKKEGSKKRGEAKRLDPEYVAKFMLDERHFRLTEPYVNANTPMKGVCLVCGYEGAPRWSDVNAGKGACGACARNKSLDPAHVRREMIKKHKFLPIQPYVSNNTPMRGICLVCKSPGAPTWNNVLQDQGACSGKCRKRGQDLSAPAVCYLVGGYVKEAGPSLKVGIAEAQREKKRAQENARLGLDTHLATLYFPTGREAKDFEDELIDLINAEPGNLNDAGLSFKGSKETFELDASDPEFLRDLLSRFGITNVPIPSLWTEDNYRSRFEAWSSKGFALAA